MEARDYVLALKKRNFTQTQISEKTGIPQPTISKIERGDVADVMSRSYRALQDFYQQEIDAEAAADLKQPKRKAVA